MKSIKLITFLVAMLAVACNSSEKNDFPENYDLVYNHLLFLSFQDAFGNDLVKGIEYDPQEYSDIGPIKSSLFTLEIVFPDEILKPYNGPYISFKAGGGFVGLYPGISIDYDRLLFSCISYQRHYDSKGNEVKIPFVEMITFKLTCPYIFDNDEVHEIVTWWELKSLSDDGDMDFALCNRVELDGKVVNKINYMYDNNISEATVIWEGKR